MKIKLYFSLLLCLITRCAFSQTPTITINSVAYGICAETLYKLPVSLKGQFNADNKFSIQIKDYYNGSVIATVPATLNNGNMEFIIGNTSLFTNNRSFYLKVVASSPVTESAWSNNTTYIYTKGNISVSLKSVSDTVNLYDEINLQFKGASNSNVTATLTDSTKYTFYAYSNQFSETKTYQVTNSGNFSIAHAENGCGVMQTSGSFKPVVNSTSLLTTGISPNTVCENSDVKISFSTQGTSLTAQTKYRVRFIQRYSSSDKQATAEVPAQLVGNVLIAKFPATFVLTSTTEFLAQILTENPSTVGATTAVQFYAAPQPSATFTTASQVVNINDYVNLGVNITGLAPFTIELSDGTKQNISYSGNSSINIRPFETTNYSIKSLSSGCGKKEFTNGQTVNITVRPGIRIEETAEQKIICGGTKGRIKFKSNASLTSATQYTVKATNGSETFTYNAVRVGEYLEFDTSHRPQGYQNLSWTISTSNPALTSQSSYYFVIQTTPNLYFSQYNNYNYELPGKAYASGTLYGGGPYTVEYADGKISQYEYNSFNTEFYLKETQDYKIKSVSNACFKNENLPSARYTVNPKDSPGIYVEPITSAVCNNDSIEVTFGTVGKFDEGNVFAIQGYSNSGTFQTLATAKQGGKLKVKLPSVQYYTSYAAIRVASTNPVIFSESKSLNIQLPVTQVSIYPESKAESPIRYVVSPTNTYNLTLQSSNSGPFSSITYTENGSEKTFNNNSDYSNYLPLSPVSGSTVEYVIKSVSNQCGTYSSGIKAFISWLPYEIQFADNGYYNSTYCVGSPIEIPFGITQGAVTNATFSLQIRKVDGTAFTTLASGTTSRILSATLPASVTAGNYIIRIISSDGASSTDRQINVGALPTATLAINPQYSSIVDFGQDVMMDVTISGSAPGMASTVIFQDGYKVNYYDGKVTRYVSAQKSGEYSLKSVSNVCGYGTTSGSVKITVRPKLTASTNSYMVCEGGTFSVTYVLGGDADLSDEYIRFELYDANNNTTTVLDSTKAFTGTKLLKIPDLLKGSAYEIRVTVKKYQQVARLYASVTTKPDVTISGNTVINSGESTKLLLRANKNSSGETQYVLSDGTKGSFYAQVGYATYLTVTPGQTTTYTISSLFNSCGEGAKSGSAVVEVNPASERTVSVTTVTGNGQSAFCTGDTVAISFTTRGSFSSSNRLTVQISDSTGRVFRPLTTIGNTSPIRAVLPADLVSTQFYRIRIIASDPNTASGAYEYPITASQKARARFKSDFVPYDGVNNPVITVLLEGGGPWTYAYGPDNVSWNRYSYLSEDKIELLQASPSTFYKLYWVRNGCGVGLVDSPATVRVEVVTGVEDPMTEEILIAPNPTSDLLHIKFNASGKRSLELFDVRGISRMKQPVNEKTNEVNIRELQTGIYILRIDNGKTQSTYRILKNQ